MMSLVNYASSSDDEDNTTTTIDDVVTDERKEQVQQEEISSKKPQQKDQNPSPSTISPDNIPRSESSSNRQPEPPSLPPPFAPADKLPDASLLLNPPNTAFSGGSDHASRVAAAMAENASRKRDSNGLSSSSMPREKIPRGTLPNTKSVPDTGGSLLVPPQLRGRSNIVTEDIGKLFVRRQPEPSA